MKIILYYNKSDSNVLDKQLEEVLTLEGTFRNECDILNPVIHINSNGFHPANYMYIEDLGRYYFIRDIVVVRTGLLECTCHVDVLMTYKLQIRQQSAVIGRSETNYNLYLNDDRLCITSKRLYSTIAFPNKVAPATDEGSLSFVLTIAGSPEVTPTNPPDESIETTE